MRSTPPIASILLCAVLCTACGGSGGGSSGGGAGSSTSGARTFDTDGDGAPDLARAGDWDGDGNYELADVQAAIDALTDPGQRRVELQPGAVYRAIDPVSPGHVYGLVELPSHTTLDCQGATLEGMDPNQFEASSWPLGTATLTNERHAAQDDVDIHIFDCVVTGGMPPSYDSIRLTNHTYMGISLIGVRGASVVASVVRDTHHACIYVKNSADVLIEGNQLERCGAVNDIRNFLTQPAVYLFQAGRFVTERITVRGNTALLAGNALFNTRVSATNDEYQTAWMRDIHFESNYAEDEDGDVCFNLRGARSVRVVGNHCHRTAGIYLSDRNTDYCANNPPAAQNPNAESGCLEDVSLEQNLLTDSFTVDSNALIHVQDFHDRVTIRDNAVLGATGPAPSFRIDLPARDLLVERLELEDCAQSCLRVDGQAQRAVPAEEQLEIRDVHADGAGLADVTGSRHACFHLATPLEGAVIEDFTAARCHVGLWIDGGFSMGAIRRFDVDAVPAGYLGAFDLSSAPMPACDAASEDRWSIVFGGDGSCGGGIGALATRCACRDGAWEPYPTGSNTGIRVDGSDRLFLEEGTVANVDGQPGIVFGVASSHDADLRDIEITQPRLGDGVLAPMTFGILDPSRSGSVRASGIVCRPGSVSQACVDL